MANTNITAFEFMQELGTWTRFTSENLEMAKKSNINTQNNVSFRMLIKQWKNGMWDEDLDALVREFLWIFTVWGKQRVN